MPTEGDVDTSRKAVKTYVPAYQKGVWKEHANRLDMTMSEFVRTMVQAGRRDFSFADDEGEPSDSQNSTGPEMADTVVDILSDEEFLSWENVLEQANANIEAQLEDAIEELQERNRIRYSGKNGGYTLVER